MIELLEQIPGPQFLLIFLIYALVVFVILKIIQNRILTNAATETSNNVDIDGLEVLILSQGKRPRNIVMTVFFTLTNRDIIIVNENIATVSENAIIGNLTEIERKIVNYFKIPNSPQSITEDSIFMSQIETLVERTHESLTKKGLYLSEEIRSKHKRIFWILFLVMAFPAVVKIIIGTSHYRPVSFLYMLLAFASVLFAIAYPREKLTSLAKKLLKQKQAEYQWARHVRGTDTSFPADNDPLMVAGLFGIGALMVFPEYSSYGDYFSFDNSSSDSFFSDSGGFSSDSSGGFDFGSDGGSSDSGSSDGGSGCGGSGCGGCGGGGGD